MFLIELFRVIGGRVRDVCTLLRRADPIDPFASRTVIKGLESQMAAKIQGCCNASGRFEFPVLFEFLIASVPSGHETRV